MRFSIRRRILDVDAKSILTMAVFGRTDKMINGNSHAAKKTSQAPVSYIKAYKNVFFCAEI